MASMHRLLTHRSTSPNLELPNVELIDDEAPNNYFDLAPQIVRQRLVIEGYPLLPISQANIENYLRQLSDHTQMRALLTPVTHRSDLYGWAGWIHWETSGAHFYAWEQPLLFFSVDIYTCKRFDVLSAVEFTGHYFAARTLCHKSF